MKVEVNAEKRFFIYFFIPRESARKEIKRHVTFLSWFKSYTSLGSKSRDGGRQSQKMLEYPSVKGFYNCMGFKHVGQLWPKTQSFFGANLALIGAVFY